MENLEELCLNRLNTLLSKFNLQITTIKDKQLNQCQYRLIYKNYTDNELASWISISDIFFTRIISIYESKSIFEYLASYYNTVSNPSFKYFVMNKESFSKFRDCSAAYKETIFLKTDSFEEFIIKMDLMGI